MVEDNASYEGDWGSQPSHLCSKRQLSYTNGICLFLVSASSAYEPLPPSIAQAWLPAISPITNVGRGRQLVTYITPHTPQPKKHSHLIDYVQDTDRTSSRHLHLGSIPYNHHCRIGCSLSPILSPIIPLDINQSSHSHARNCHVRYGTHAEGL